MRQVRNGVFETNSSSTHSIAIPKKANREYPTWVDFWFGRFGWKFEQVRPADYLYTAICYYDDKDTATLYLEKLKAVLDSHGIRYTMQKPEWRSWEYNKTEVTTLESDIGCIDHVDELGSFLTRVFADDETLLDFIFYGYVFTGNDNEDDNGFLEPYKKTYKTYDYDIVTGWTTEEKENPHYDPKYEDYDWYWKGN